jgi:hypothetical protein
MLPRVEDDSIWVPPDSVIQTQITSGLDVKRTEGAKKAWTQAPIDTNVLSLSFTNSGA